MPVVPLLVFLVAATPEPVCPLGDAPAEVGTLLATGRQERLEVHDGWAVLVIEDRLTNTGAGPAILEALVALPPGMAYVRAASITEQVEDGPHGAVPVTTRTAVLDDESAARLAFNDYVRALELGVPRAEAHEEDRGAALLVRHEDTGVTVGVAAPCSLRLMKLRLEVVLVSLPLDGGWQFEVPSGLDGGNVAIEVVTDEASQVSVAGEALRPQDQANAASAAPLLPVVVRPLATGMRTRAIAESVTPVAPTPPADHAADPVPASADGVAVAVAAPPTAPVVLVRAELDLPAVLSEAPAGLRLVFVVDTSVSVGARALAKAWQLVDGILAAAPPDARYAVIGAGRRPRVLVAPWHPRNDRPMPVAEVENGSDMVAALRRAQGIAADVSAGDEVGRVVLVSDMQLRFTDTDARLVQGFRGTAGPLTHVVVLPEDADPAMELSWARSYSEADPRAAGPESTGGIWIETGFGDDEERALYPHLIRPTRLDHPRVLLAGHDAVEEAIEADVHLSPRDDTRDEPGSHGVPRFLVEGSGLRFSASLPFETPTASVLVGGLLWARPLEQRAGTFRDRAPLGVSAVDGVGAALHDDVVRGLAVGMNAVTRVTSLVEVPSFRPGTDAIHGWGCSCCGGSCSSRCGGAHSCGGIRSTADLQERETLGRLLADDLARCGVRSATVEVEFGDLEILDLDAGAAGSCVAERMWSHRLDLLVEGRERLPGAFVGHRRIDVEASAAPAR